MATQEVSAFIGDGYEVERFIRGKARLYPDMRLTVRVMLPADRSQWLAEIGRAADDEKTAVTSRWIAGRIVKWSESVKPTAENVGRLTPGLYDRIFAVVWGEDGGDPFPETGKVPETDQDADAGNSQSG